MYFLASVFLINIYSSARKKPTLNNGKYILDMLHILLCRKHMRNT